MTGPYLSCQKVYAFLHVIFESRLRVSKDCMVGGTLNMHESCQEGTTGSPRYGHRLWQAVSSRPSAACWMSLKCSVACSLSECLSGCHS